ncbi:MAG: hypothetical protein IKR31_08070 [Prevotella sp.]|jgi:hypothetical protein|nr:hypothetical protein [Prevotella sp.]
MKKLSFLAVVFAAITFGACGGNKGAQGTDTADSLKSFEQEQIEAAIKMHFDSLASELGKLKHLPVVMKDGSITLTDQEKQVKPDYLLDMSVADNAITLSEKYCVLSAIEVDKEVAKLYDMPLDEYDKAITKLASDINDPSFKAIDDVSDIYATTEALYNAMNENGRINYFWQIVATSLLEQLYVTSQNTEKFVAAFDDDAAANVTFRIILIEDALNRLTEYDPELAPVAKAISPLTVLNATTVDEFKTQLADAKERIAASRNSLVNLGH